MNTQPVPMYSNAKHKEINEQIDIEAICSDLMKCSNNREMFNAIMNDLREEVLGDYYRTTKTNQIQIKSFKEFLQYNDNKPNSNNNNNNMNNMNINMKYGLDSNQPSHMMPLNPEYYPYKFTPSVPEGEMANMKPFKAKIMHKNYTDVHANSKFYYSNQFIEGNELTTDSQWINKTNNIMMNSQGQNWLNLRDNDITNQMNQPNQYHYYMEDKKRYSPI